MPVRRPRSRPMNAPRSKAGSIGSGAMCAIIEGSSAPPVARTRWPNVRWSLNRRSGPESAKVNVARTCGDTGAPGSESRNCPLIPRCARRASSATGSHRYLPRLRAAVMVRPRSAAAKSSAPATCRRTARGCSTAASAMVRPTTWRSRPLRTVSTSGSSGTLDLSYFRHARPQVVPPRLAARSTLGRGGCAAGVPSLRLGLSLIPGQRLGLSLVPGPVPVADRGPGGLGGLLLGLFLRVPLPRSVAAPADPDRGAEELLVVRPALLDVVLGHAEEPGGGEFLQRGLPVQARAEPRRTGDHRVEQPVHQRPRFGQAQLEVDRADHGLQRVGEDGGLVPATGALLAPAQAHVGSQLELAGHARQGAHVDHGRAQLGQLALRQVGILAE